MPKAPKHGPLFTRTQTSGGLLLLKVNPDIVSDILTLPAELQLPCVYMLMRGKIPRKTTRHSAVTQNNEIHKQHQAPLLPFFPSAE